MARHLAALLLVAGTLSVVSAASDLGSEPRSEPEGAFAPGAEPNLVSGFPARADGGWIHVVVEIPTGTTAKWEVDKRDGSLRWEQVNGEPRIVRYLGYPGNYGMVPRTLLPRGGGGDGDPLDVLVLGPPLERGAVVRARLIGVLRLLDGGEQDDKLIAVQEGTPLAEARTVAELEEKFNGATAIVETWFTNYKGSGVTESRGFADVGEANAILDAAITSYERANAAPPP